MLQRKATQIYVSYGIFSIPQARNLMPAKNPHNTTRSKKNVAFHPNPYGITCELIGVIKIAT